LSKSNADSTARFSSAKKLPTLTIISFGPICRIKERTVLRQSLAKCQRLDHGVGHAFVEGRKYEYVRGTQLAGVIIGMARRRSTLNLPRNSADV
jgi:hypothetical protein